MARRSTTGIAAGALVTALLMAIPVYAIVFGRLIVAGGDLRQVELVIRDITVYFGIWFVLGAALVVRTGRVIERPMRRMNRVLRRIAAGDLDAELPSVHGKLLGSMVESFRATVLRSSRRDALKSARLIELRALIQRLAALPKEPLLVVGLDRQVQYANDSADAAFGSGSRLSGRGLDSLVAAPELLVLANRLFRKRLSCTIDDVSVQADTGVFDAVRGSVVTDTDGQVVRVAMMFVAKECD